MSPLWPVPGGPAVEVGNWGLKKYIRASRRGANRKDQWGIPMIRFYRGMVLLHYSHQQICVGGQPDSASIRLIILPGIPSIGKLPDAESPACWSPPPHGREWVWLLEDMRMPACPDGWRGKISEKTELFPLQPRVIWLLVAGNPGFSGDFPVLFPISTTESILSWLSV